MDSFDPTQIKIVVAIEDLKLQDFVALMLMGEGYSVKTYFTQEDILRDIGQEPVDLIIIDFLSPKIDGLKFCKATRENFLSRYTPILLIVPEETPLLKSKAIFIGANDFVEKPFSPEELLTRVKASLLRAQRYQDINPLTKLPGISTTVKELDARIKSQQLFGVACLDLDRLEKFNKRYGFAQGDQVLKYSARLITQALLRWGEASDFLSHMGSDDFFLITSADGIESTCRQIVKDFDENIPAFYAPEERKHGYITLKDRKGEVFKVPLLRIYIGVVTNEHYPFGSSAQIIQIATELKNYAKSFPKSIYIKERRRSYPFY